MQVTICDCCGKQHQNMEHLTFENDIEFRDAAGGRSERGEDHYDLCPNCITNFVIKLLAIYNKNKEFIHKELKKFIELEKSRR